MTTTEMSPLNVGPDLPTDLHPVALAAHNMPARTWGIVACPDDGEPLLLAEGLVSSVAVMALAYTMDGTYGPHTYIVYRCPQMVTVHTTHLNKPNNIIGSLPVEYAETKSRWQRILAAPRTPEREQLLLAAIRLAHGLAPETSDTKTLLRVLTAPVDDTVYLSAYVMVLGSPNALHEYANREQRIQHQHTSCPRCDSKTPGIRCWAPRSTGSPCNHVWHDR